MANLPLPPGHWPEPALLDWEFLSALNYIVGPDHGKPKTIEGRQKLQDIHDTAAFAGASCNLTDAQRQSQYLPATVQVIHDITTDHGATCSCRA